MPDLRLSLALFIVTHSAIQNTNLLINVSNALALPAFSKIVRAGNKQFNAFS